MHDSEEWMRITIECVSRVTGTLSSARKLIHILEEKQLAGSHFRILISNYSGAILHFIE
jgi:hypothetical protein